MVAEGFDLGGEAEVLGAEEEGGAFDFGEGLEGEGIWRE